MFRNSLRDFEEDPFFRDHHQRMTSMFGGFEEPFPNLGFRSMHPALGYGGRADRNRHGDRQVAPTDMFGSMFNNMFTNMNSMMANMHRNFEQMANDPNTYSYSSSSVMSYSHDGRGEPKYFQASKSTKRAPGGVRETQHAVRDSESGLHRMAIGHHLDDRSHMIERSVNKRTGEEERKQDFVNIDESDAGTFDQEWKRRTRQPTNTLRDRRQANLRALGGTDPRDRHTHHGRHAGNSDRYRLRGIHDGPGTHVEMENRRRDHSDRDHTDRDHRDRDWGTGDFDGAGKNHRGKSNRQKHVRVNSRPMNRHEPRGGL